MANSIATLLATKVGVEKSNRQTENKETDKANTEPTLTLCTYGSKYGNLFYF